MCSKKVKEITTGHQQKTKSQLFSLFRKVISPFCFLNKPSIKFPALNLEVVGIYTFVLFRGGKITLMYMYLYMLQIALSLLPVAM